VGGAGASLELEGGAIRGGAAVADDVRAPARPRGEDAVIQKQIHGGAGNEGRELLQEFDGLEEEVRRAITPGGLELDEDAPVGAEADAVLGERGAEEITAELLQPGAIVGGLSFAITWSEALGDLSRLV
jgi:hypothetical protein